MRKLHLVQGGITNGDKAWLEKAARDNLSSRTTWVIPSCASIGDQVVIYIAGLGFFATAQAISMPKRRDDWPNRFGSSISSIRLIKPPISLVIIRRSIPELTWANYPRSITTPSQEIAVQIKDLIRERRKTGLPKLGIDMIYEANMGELLRVALAKARPSTTISQRKVNYRLRSMAIHRYVLLRANGYCEACNSEAPFQKADGSPYLEPHHTKRLADDGPDHPSKVIAVCPNCHRKAHHAKNAKAFNRRLIEKLARLERQ